MFEFRNMYSTVVNNACLIRKHKYIYKSMFTIYILYICKFIICEYKQMLTMNF